jgi:hypothetical protein
VFGPSAPKTYGLPIRLHAFCAARPPRSLVYVTGHGPVRSLPGEAPLSPYARIRSFCRSLIFFSMVFFVRASSASRVASDSVSTSRSRFSVAYRSRSFATSAICACWCRASRSRKVSFSVSPVGEPDMIIDWRVPGGPCLYASAARPLTLAIATLISSSRGVRRLVIALTWARLSLSLLWTSLYCSMIGSSLFHSLSIWSSTFDGEGVASAGPAVPVNTIPAAATVHSRLRRTRFTVRVVPSSRRPPAGRPSAASGGGPADRPVWPMGDCGPRTTVPVMKLRLKAEASTALYACAP